MTRAKSPYYEFDRHCFPVRIYFCPDKAAWDRLIKSKGGNDEYPCGQDGTAGRAAFLRDDGVIICLRKENRTPTEYAGIMMHELMHVVQHIERVVYPLNENGRLDNETQAYLIHALSMWALDVLQECGFFGGAK